MNWNDKASVIAYAKRLGKGMTVFKHPGRSDFNITFTQHPERFAGCSVVFQT